MASASSEHIFTFGLITDTHIRPAEGDESSPFPVNELANGRARYAVALLAAQKNCAFYVHMGDMVHPLPHLPTYEAACEEAHEIFTPLKADASLRFVPGNHDLGDKPFKSSPAAPASPEAIAIYEHQFGPSFHAFSHENCAFLTVNSSLVNSGLEAEAEQRTWLEGELAQAAGQRIFIFSHYPPFIDTTDEPSHYDNYDEPGRAWFLKLIQDHNVEAVFSGHVHQFFYNRTGKTKFYCLPSTSFIRQDYAELYRVDPSPEYGRNDAGKFSVAHIEILRDGHRVCILPTDGKEIEADATQAAAPLVATGGQGQGLTVHLRHAWAEAIDLPYNGPMEEFSRKRARNDYTLARLWQMGISKVRTPLADLVDPSRRARMLDFHAAGMTFTLFTVGVPDAAAWALVKQHAGIIDAVELVSAAADLAELASDMDGLTPIDGVPLFVGKYHSSADEPQHGSKFAHSVSFGFKWDDRQIALDALKLPGLAGKVAGLVFQINMGDDLPMSVRALDQLAVENGIEAAANVRFADINPAIANFDDAAIAERVGLAIELTDTLRKTRLQLDTFADVDRGYNARHGLIDRLYNFRAAGRLLAGL